MEVEMRNGEIGIKYVKDGRVLGVRRLRVVGI